MSTEKEKEALVDAPASTDDSTDDKADIAPPAYQQSFQLPGQPLMAQPTVVYAQVRSGRVNCTPILSIYLWHRCDSGFLVSLKLMAF